jgi:hypothetical protein
MVQMLKELLKIVHVADCQCWQYFATFDELLLTYLFIYLFISWFIYQAITNLSGDQKVKNGKKEKGIWFKPKTNADNRMEVSRISHYRHPSKRINIWCNILSQIYSLTISWILSRIGTELSCQSCRQSQIIYGSEITNILWVKLSQNCSEFSIFSTFNSIKLF